MSVGKTSPLSLSSTMVWTSSPVGVATVTSWPRSRSLVTGTTISGCSVPKSVDTTMIFFWLLMAPTLRPAPALEQASRPHFALG